jgi:hypothetical protein
VQREASRRLWGLSRRQTVVVLCAAVLVGIVGALVIGGSGSSGDGAPSRLGIRRIRTGSPASPHAVWVFGFQTLRLDPALRRAEELPVTGFGAVQGTDGRVYLYEAGSGRVGVLVAARNRLDTLAVLAPGTVETNPWAPVVAVDGHALWLVDAPGRVTRFDVPGRRAGPPIAVTVPGAGPSTVTGVVAAAGSVFAASRDAAGVAVARVDPSSSAVTVTGHFALDASATLDGFATDGTHVWVLAAGTLYDLDATTLGVDRTIQIPRQTPGSVKGAAVARGGVWLLADNGATLARVDAASGRVTAPLEILADTPAGFRIPASLVSDGTSVWAMVQRDDDPASHRVRVVGFDARTRTATRAADLPSSLFAGAAAVT